MDIRQLRYFVAVAEHQNFHRAADALHVAQSALSKHVSQLELHVGGSLLERGPRGVSLTPLGNAFYSEAKYLLGRFDSIIDRTKKTLAEDLGPLTLGVNDAGTQPLLARCINRFRELHPDVDLTCVRMNNEVMFKEIQAGRLNAAVVFNMPGAIVDLDHVTLETMTVMIALSEDHPLAAHAAIKVSALQSEPFINVNPSGHEPLYLEMSSRCADIGLNPRYVASAASDRMQFSLIRERMGVGIVFSYATDYLPQGVVVRPIAGLNLKIENSLVWSKSSQSPSLSEFLHLVTKVVEDQGDCVEHELALSQPDN